jgi:hypothetical protein
LSKKKTPQEVALLKEEWLAYPYWALENAEGFEEYHTELRQFRLAVHNRIEEERRQRLASLIRSVNAYESEISWSQGRDQFIHSRASNLR